MQALWAALGVGGESGLAATPMKLRNAGAGRASTNQLVGSGERHPNPAASLQGKRHACRVQPSSAHKLPGSLGPPPAPAASATS